MSKNKVQFQLGYSLLTLFSGYGIEDQCRQSCFKGEMVRRVCLPRMKICHRALSDVALRTPPMPNRLLKMAESYG